MAHSRERHKQEKRLRARRPTVELELYVHEKASCDCRVEEIPVEIEEGKQIYQALHYDEKSKLVWFAVLFNRLRDGRGEELYSVDTSHGHFHEHTTGHKKRNDRRNIRPLYSQVNVQESFDTGYDMVLNKYLVMSGR